jgi:hypothetical protein
LHQQKKFASTYGKICAQQMLGLALLALRQWVGAMLAPRRKVFT